MDDSPGPSSGTNDRGGADACAAEPRAKEPGAADFGAAGRGSDAQDVARPLDVEPEAAGPRDGKPGDDAPDTARNDTARPGAAEIEARLLARAGAGDAAAAATLLDRLGPRLMAFCLRMTGGDRAQAEDVMQEAFLRLWKRAGDWDAGGAARLSTWLGRVAANLAVDAKRRTRRMRPLDDGMELADAAPSAVAGLIRAERLSALDAALAILPERQRQAVVLRHVEGYSNPDIAAILGCGVEAVESLTARAKKRLAEILRDGGGAE